MSAKLPADLVRGLRALRRASDQTARDSESRAIQSGGRGLRDTIRDGGARGRSWGQRGGVA
eukprot:1581640-Pyramimonas_sp.AAC.1